ncbi:MAG: hypothetical protein ACRC6T_11070 [Sarcina sp.]
MKLKEKINKENIMAIKATVSELMEKKGELEYQIQDFKDSVKDIKAKKEVVLKMIDEINPKLEVPKNRVWKMVEEKRKKK